MRYNRKVTIRWLDHLQLGCIEILSGSRRHDLYEWIINIIYIGYSHACVSMHISICMSIVIIRHSVVDWKRQRVDISIRPYNLYNPILQLNYHCLVGVFSHFLGEGCQPVFDTKIYRLWEMGITGCVSARSKYNYQ